MIAEEWKRLTIKPRLHQLKQPNNSGRRRNRKLNPIGTKPKVHPSIALGHCFCYETATGCVPHRLVECSTDTALPRPFPPPFCVRPYLVSLRLRSSAYARCAFHSRLPVAFHGPVLGELGGILFCSDCRRYLSRIAFHHRKYDHFIADRSTPGSCRLGALKFFVSPGC